MKGVHLQYLVCAPDGFCSFQVKHEFGDNQRVVVVTQAKPDATFVELYEQAKAIKANLERNYP